MVIYLDDGTAVDDCDLCGGVLGKDHYYDQNDDEYLYCMYCVHLNRKEW